MELTSQYPVPAAAAAKAHINREKYLALYQQSITDPEGFWAQQAQELITWFHPWQRVLSGEFTKGTAQWFVGAQLNVAFNCLDRHLPQRAQQTAIIWEGDTPDQSRHISYQELFDDVCRFANVLKSLDVSTGDRVAIYLPMIPEAAIAMLACARIGAIHSVVFAGFSAHALAERIQDARCKLLITADVSIRGSVTHPLKQHADVAVIDCPAIQNVIVVKQQNSHCTWYPERDVDYCNAMATAELHCPAESVAATHPLFILYTSGSTGKPKGVLHHSAGYLLYATCTFRYIFDYHDGDIFWCTADVGWITGHTYTLYSVLANGGTTLMYAGVPIYPTPARYWQIIDKHHVNIFYTAPTALRTLMREGDAPVKSTQRHSLKLLGTVGEPINPEVWRWYYTTVGEQRCPIVDTWWQTETGAAMLTPLPGATSLKPGSATLPFFGIQPALIDDAGQHITGAGHGRLVITTPWPGLLAGIYNNAERYHQAYFAPIPGTYFTGDGAYRDEDGYYWITGRIDDVLNVSGHRIGTAEVESAIVTHPQIAEAAVVGIAHETKGEGIYAFVTPMAGVQHNDALRKTVIETVRKQIGPIATPDHIQWTAQLPKTRSGKIMRRILRKIANGETKELGDTSTLANPEVIDDLIGQRQKS